MSRIACCFGVSPSNQSFSTVLFELFSEGTNTTSFPYIDDLWVRFLYRNSTDDDAPVWEYPLFGLGNSETRIKYKDFASSIQRFSLDDIPTWCNVCDAVSLFCATTRQTSNGSKASSNSKDRNLSPAIAGVIGAFMAVAATSVAAVLLFVFGGFRFRRNPDGLNSFLGGFKGAEKMASDQDLSVANSGAKHERVGSWELGKAGRAIVEVSQGDASKQEPVFGATHMRNIDDDDDSILMGGQPVKPREGI